MPRWLEARSVPPCARQPPAPSLAKRAWKSFARLEMTVAPICFFEGGRCPRARFRPFLNSPGRTCPRSSGPASPPSQRPRGPRTRASFLPHAVLPAQRRPTVTAAAASSSSGLPRALRGSPRAATGASLPRWAEGRRPRVPRVLPLFSCGVRPDHVASSPGVSACGSHAQVTRVLTGAATWPSQGRRGTGGCPDRRPGTA